MTYLDFNQTQKTWEYTEISSIHYFLEAIKDVLTKENVQSNVILLQRYMDECKFSETEEIYFDSITIKLKGIDEVHNTKMALETALANYNLK